MSHARTAVEVNSPITGHDYIRTPEDDENDRNERAWKDAATQEVCKSFLRRYPSGRLPQYS